MKKTLLIAAMAALAMGASLWGQTINVSSPGAGNDWCLGSSHTITWTSSGVSGNVMIVLRPADAPMADPVLTIVASTANDGSHSWSIPGSGLAAGTYEVRVRTVTTDPFVFGDSANFTISSCPAPSASITVTAPGAGDDWCLGSSNAITWTSSGVSGNVMIVLRPADAPMADPVLTIAASTANDGSYSWSIPGSGLAAGTYEVRVRTVTTDPFVFGDSANFEVKDCVVGPSITVTKPSVTHGWCVGRSGLIQWTSSGVTSAFVKIILYLAPYSPGAIGSMLTAHTSNDGEYTWDIPDTQATGDYVVKVQTTTGSISDFSETFKINHCIDADIWQHLQKIRYYIRIPRWPPEPDPWWEIDFREFYDMMHNKFEGSVFLLKNGQKVKEIGKFGKTTPLPDSLKFQMGELNSKSLKNRSSKFSIGIFDAQGKLLQENPLEVQVEQQLR